MDIADHNRRAWNRQAAEGCRWSKPVDGATLDRARQGDWSIILTPNKPVPRDWFPPIKDLAVLCLASGGGQQAPVLAAAGARVTSFDNSEGQLALDRETASAHGLRVETVRGDMADLSGLPDAAFGCIVHPVANVFTPDVLPVWRACFRVLRPGGVLLAGFMNPAFFLFDHEALERGEAPTLRYKLPYADTEQLPPERLRQTVEAGVALEFSHSLESQIGGQCAAGFHITALYEDTWDPAATPLDAWLPLYLATRAQKA